ncbi:hypothetical protein PUV54_02940 [Hyphococcus flavus]|uniref:Uncharacterized protein n=1 Tax=Hyphococcus flavus TaxID=1866326 RepID=A0AAE9ZG62_9PROT|nr:hypothetical protein [Hyphococcus flavus]WDI32147.1 hypothetical protein PUV54_02940 [Hyphococcus flavus]
MLQQQSRTRFFVTLGVWAVAILMISYGAGTQDRFDNYWANFAHIGVMVLSIVGAFWIIRRYVPRFVGRNPFLQTGAGLLILFALMFVQVYWLDDLIRMMI